MTADEIRKCADVAMDEARRVLADSGISISCGDGHSGFGWYVYFTGNPEAGSIKLEAPPLPPSMCNSASEYHRRARDTQRVAVEHPPEIEA